jgi:hypothetical protein
VRIWAGLGIALTLAACASAPVRPTLTPAAAAALATPGKLPDRNGDPYVGPIRVYAEPIPLDPRDPRHIQLGNFRYAGGVHLVSDQSLFLHGISDLKVRPDGSFLAQSDVAYQFEGKVLLDRHDQLVGISVSRILPMKDEKGDRLFPIGQQEYDSEGVAELPNGDRISTFEHHDRALLYPKDGGPPRPIPFPPGKYAVNESFEAVMADPSVAPDAYRVGVEPTGKTWLCRVSTTCEPGPDIDLEGLELVGFERVPDGRIAVLLRRFTAERGNVVRVVILDKAWTKVDEMEISAPLTQENFEGVGVVPGRNGALRIYLICDDNFGIFDNKPTGQKTLMMAFDWTPPKEH